MHRSALLADHRGGARLHNIFVEQTFVDANLYAGPLVSSQILILG